MKCFYHADADGRTSGYLVYHSAAMTDDAISKALIEKRNFNDNTYIKW